MKVKLRFVFGYNPVEKSVKTKTVCSLIKSLLQRLVLLQKFIDDTM